MTRTPAELSRQPAAAPVESAITQSGKALDSTNVRRSDLRGRAHFGIGPQCLTNRGDSRGAADPGWSMMTPS